MRKARFTQQQRIARLQPSASSKGASTHTSPGAGISRWPIAGRPESVLTVSWPRSG